MFGKDKKKEPPKEKTTEERLKAMEDGFVKMTTAMEGLPNTIGASIAQAMGDQHKTQAQKDAEAAEHQRLQKEEADKKKSQELDEDTLEGMSRKDFLAYMSKHISDVVLKPVVDKFEQVDDDSARERQKQDFLHYAQANPEFVHWRAELTPVLERNPELSPADALALAKSKATKERHDEVRKAVDPKAVEEEAAKKKEEEQVADIISFFPRAAPREDEDSGRMSAGDAAEDAWDRTFGSTTQLTGDMSR